MSSKKQTVSYLRQRFSEIGFRPYAKHGQNFLIDLNILDFIVREADIQPNDVVLEVGMGTGSLTVRLAEQAAHVVSVEIDPHLAQLAQEQFDLDSPITILQHDVLKNKNRLHPDVLETVRTVMASVPEARFKLVANLPYSVATPIISNLLASDLPPHSMTVTIQKELGDRIVAEPRSKDYSSLSVWVQSQCEVAIARELAPTVFWPRPKVYSAIVSMVLAPERRSKIAELPVFHHFVRHLFIHRRKFLRGSLLAAFKSLDKPTVDQVMEDLGFDASSRAEELTVPQILQLHHATAAFVKADVP